ncbi:MAG: hypothetical protein ABR928_09525 [Terracidiphilus sp.]|jgi:hypothetical protein
MSTPDGYAAHHTVDVGGRISGVAGSGAMYDTLVNLQSGPRMTGETFEMHALTTNKHPLVDNLSAVGTGFGGDPYNFAKLDFSKGKLYEFSGMFRRDRQYFDYDLLGNPNIPGGQSIPIGSSTSPSSSYAWSQVMQSPFMNNSVRRMTDTNLTLLPLSTVTFRFAYSQNIFEGPSLTPSGYQVGGSYDVLLQEYQRNSTDDFTGGVDWKPFKGTKFTFEEQIDHYKGDSYFSLAPQSYLFQEADGTRVAPLVDYDSFVPYGVSSKTGAFAPSGVCNGSIANSSTVLYPNPSGGAPIIDPACNVITSYFRSQPTRIIYPTEIFRLQSSSITNVSMNGDARYTSSNMSLPNYYDSFQGLAGANRELAYTAVASARRQVFAADYGIVWQATKKVNLEDQVDFSDVHQPGSAEFTSGTTVTVPTTTGAETINNTNLTSTTVTTGGAPFEGSPAIGTPTPAYFGQRFLTNDATVGWDVASRATVSLTYRHRQHVIAENVYSAASKTAPEDPGGNPGNVPLAAGATTDGTVTINQNGAIFTVALRPAANWQVNGSVELLYADNVFTPIAPRQLQHYRIHTLFRPKTWATISGAYNDLERHNNTNNMGATPADGPLGHVDHSRTVALNADLARNEHYGFDFSYSYGDVYSSTNICFLGSGSATVPGAATPTGAACPTPAPRSAGSSYTFGPVKDFEDAPTQSGSVALTLSPVDKIHANIGYRVNSTNGTRFFNDPRDVNGTLVSTYQTPFVNVAWTVHKDLTWKGEYNYFGYGEGGPSGAQYCSTSSTLPSPTAAAPVEACSSLPNTAINGPAYGFTAPRNFHANNVSMGVHYEF